MPDRVACALAHRATLCASTPKVLGIVSKPRENALELRQAREVISIDDTSNARLSIDYPNSQQLKVISGSTLDIKLSKPDIFSVI